MLNGDPVLSDLDSFDRLIVLEVINKAFDMTKLLTTTNLLTS